MTNQSLIIGIIIGFILCYLLVKNNDCSKLDKNIKTLIRQTARWSVAAIQDKNPLIAVLHANYGTGYLGALRDIATDQQIKNATGIDIREFSKHIIDIQEKTTKYASFKCPQFAPEMSYLAKIAGDL